MNNPQPRFVGLREAARFYNTTPTTMKRWILANDIPYSQPVSRLRINLADLIAALGEPEHDPSEDR